MSLWQISLINACVTLTNTWNIPSPHKHYVQDCFCSQNGVKSSIVCIRLRVIQFFGVRTSSEPGVVFLLVASIFQNLVHLSLWWVSKLLLQCNTWRISDFIWSSGSHMISWEWVLMVPSLCLVLALMCSHIYQKY